MEALAANYGNHLDQLKAAIQSSELLSLYLEDETEDLYKQMDEIMTRMNPILEGFPESLGELRIQLLKAADDLEKQTQLLLEDSNKNAKEHAKNNENK